MYFFDRVAFHKIRSERALRPIRLVFDGSAASCGDNGSVSLRQGG
jgi:hypothetical protein